MADPSTSDPFTLDLQGILAAAQARVKAAADAAARGTLGTTTGSSSASSGTTTATAPAASNGNPYPPGSIDAGSWDFLKPIRDWLGVKETRPPYSPGASSSQNLLMKYLGIDTSGFLTRSIAVVLGLIFIIAGIYFLRPVQQAVSSTAKAGSKFFM